ncbi:MAG: DUF1538 domain-containing protein [Pseudohongiella sp.]|nr:DUF1538 domain-containing protein [Pseudohongiella sp.]
MALVRRGFLTILLNSMRDLLPIILVVAFFQLIVIGQPLPDAASLLLGIVFVVLGLALFVYGLDISLFPLGESMAHNFAKKGNLVWLLLFGFCLGFATTIAEPALIAIAGEAATIAASEGQIDNSEAAMATYALRLRLVVAAAVGTAIVLGIFRIIKGWPLHYLIIGGYTVVIMMTGFAPPEIIGIAYDAGGVTTSTITVPLVTALGIGLAMSIEGRNPAIDGFGLIAFASLMPMIFVILYGVLM